MVDRSLEAAVCVLRRHGASVEALAGDAVLGLFGFPKAHEDDPLRAVRAASEVCDAVREAGVADHHGLHERVSIGVESGEVVVGPAGGGHSTASGDVVNVAVALGRHAAAGDVLVGEATRRLVGGSVALTPVEQDDLFAWRLTGLASARGAEVTAGPLVGRVVELGFLVDACERVARIGAVLRLTVVGEPGIGKSRLGRELARRTAHRSLTGQCPAYGEGILYWPLREIVMQAVGEPVIEKLEHLLGDASGRDVAQIAGVIGLADQPAAANAPFPAIRRFLEALAREGPLVLVLEDLHWAEPSLLDLVEYLTEWTRGPVLLLCLARPELLESRPRWSEGTRSSDTLSLEPLSRDETALLVSERVGPRTMSPQAGVSMVEISQGNPLYAEQLVAAYEETGAVSLTPSLQALLASRLDRLGPAERDVLRGASVIGTVFTAEALAALVPEQARAHVGRHLDSLERRHLLNRGYRDEFTFLHVLSQHAAYRSMARQDRADLHRRHAEWLAGAAPRKPLELDEILGFHLEQAVEHGRAAGLPESQQAPLAVRAGEHLATAGARAYGRFDVAAAENLFSRAQALLPSEHPRQAEARRVLAEAYAMLGRHDQADVVLAEILQQAQPDADKALEQAVIVEQLRIRLVTGSDLVSLAAIIEQAKRARKRFVAWVTSHGPPTPVTCSVPRTDDSGMPPRWSVCRATGSSWRTAPVGGARRPACGGTSPPRCASAGFRPRKLSSCARSSQNVPVSFTPVSSANWPSCAPWLPGSTRRMSLWRAVG